MFSSKGKASCSWLEEYAVAVSQQSSHNRQLLHRSPSSFQYQLAVATTEWLPQQAYTQPSSAQGIESATCYFISAPANSLLPPPLPPWECPLERNPLLPSTPFISLSSFHTLHLSLSLPLTKHSQGKVCKILQPLPRDHCWSQKQVMKETMAKMASQLVQRLVAKVKATQVASGYNYYLALVYRESSRCKKQLIFDRFPISQREREGESTHLLVRGSHGSCPPHLSALLLWARVYRFTVFSSFPPQPPTR